MSTTLRPFEPDPEGLLAWPVALTVLVSGQTREPVSAAKKAFAQHLVQHGEVYTAASIRVSDDLVAPSPEVVEVSTPERLDELLVNARFAALAVAATDEYHSPVPDALFDPKRDRLAVVEDGRFRLGEPDDLATLFGPDRNVYLIVLPLVITGSFPPND